MTTRKLSRITSRNAGWQRRKDIEYFFLVIFTEATIGKKNNNQVDVDQHKINLNHFYYIYAVYIVSVLFKTKPTALWFMSFDIDFIGDGFCTDRTSVCALTYSKRLNLLHKRSIPFTLPSITTSSEKLLTYDPQTMMAEVNCLIFSHLFRKHVNKNYLRNRFKRL